MPEDLGDGLDRHAGEPLFLLRPNEKIDISGHNIQYRGPAFIVSTSGFGGTSGGLFGGAAHGKQQKRENSV
jgi:hypothetical protein